MTEPSNVLLYVTDPEVSAHFYTELFGRGPVEASPKFAMFVFPAGLALGLWALASVEPMPTTSGGCSEISFGVGSREAVDAAHAEWQAKGATIVLPPTDLDFGRSFVAIDPDGHRLRVYALTAET